VVHSAIAQCLPLRTTKDNLVVLKLVTSEVPMRFVNAVVEAYRNRQISPSKGAAYLMTTENEFLARFGDIYEAVEM
jgi:hypothetical protein